jgi:hypothetical membrane protein
MKRMIFGSVLWTLCLQYFIAEAIAISGWPGSYSLRENYISDLGAAHCGASAGGPVGAQSVICSPLHLLMNASFLLQGLLIVFGALLVRPSFPKRGLWTAAMRLIGFAGVGVFVVGLAPEDVAPKLHFVGAVANLVCCNAGMAAMGIAMLHWNDGALRIRLSGGRRLSGTWRRRHGARCRLSLSSVVGERGNSALAPGRFVQRRALKGMHFVQAGGIDLRAGRLD